MVWYEDLMTISPPPPPPNGASNQDPCEGATNGEGEAQPPDTKAYWCGEEI